LVMDDEMMTQAEVARALGISPAAVGRIIASGELKAVRLVSRAMVARAWLAEWMSTPGNEWTVAELNLTDGDIIDRFEDLAERTSRAVRAGATRLSQIPAAHASIDSVFGGAFAANHDGGTDAEEE
jgi:hypothetical protein